MRAQTAILAILCTVSAGCAQTGSDVTLSFGVSPIEFVREDNRHPYGAVVPVQICNAGSGEVHPTRLALRGKGGRVDIWLEWETDVLVPAGECLVRRVYLSGGKAQWFVGDLEFTEDGRAGAIAGEFRVGNKDLEHRLAQCEACNGQWGRHGMLRWEGCICRTLDAGKSCHDGNDCEGLCLYKEMELVSAAQEPRCEPSGECRVRLAVRRPVGVCSEFKSMYGCIRLIRKGAALKTASEIPYEVSTICID